MNNRALQYVILALSCFLKTSVIKRKCAKNAARCTMLEIVENIIIGKSWRSRESMGTRALLITRVRMCACTAVDSRDTIIKIPAHLFRPFSAVELMPRLFEIGEVGIPLTINEGCLFEASDILHLTNALVITGFMRLKEFVGVLSNVHDEGNNAGGPETGPGTAAVAEMAAEAADAAAAALAEAAALASASAAAALERELEQDGERK